MSMSEIAVFEGVTLFIAAIDIRIATFLNIFIEDRAKSRYLAACPKRYTQGAFMRIAGVASAFPKHYYNQQFWWKRSRTIGGTGFPIPTFWIVSTRA